MDINYASSTANQVPGEFGDGIAPSLLNSLPDLPDISPPPPPSSHETAPSQAPPEIQPPPNEQPPPPGIPPPPPPAGLFLIQISFLKLLSCSNDMCETSCFGVF